MCGLVCYRYDCVTNEVICKSFCFNLILCESVPVCDECDSGDLVWDPVPTE